MPLNGALQVHDSHTAHPQPASLAQILGKACITAGIWAYLTLVSSCCGGSAIQTTQLAPLAGLENKIAIQQEWQLL